jgi:hypothetical protein
VNDTRNVVAELAKELGRCRTFARVIHKTIATFRKLFKGGLRVVTTPVLRLLAAAQRRVRSWVRQTRRAFNALLRAVLRIWRPFDPGDTGDALTLSQTVGSHRSRAPGRARRTSTKGQLRELAPI